MIFNCFFNDQSSQGNCALNSPINYATDISTTDNPLSFRWYDQYVVFWENHLPLQICNKALEPGPFPAAGIIHQHGTWLWIRRHMQPLILFDEQYGALKRQGNWVFLCSRFTDQFSKTKMYITLGSRSTREEFLKLLGEGVRNQPDRLPVPDFSKWCTTRSLSLLIPILVRLFLSAKLWREICIKLKIDLVKTKFALWKISTVIWVSYMCAKEWPLKIMGFFGLKNG